MPDSHADTVLLLGGTGRTGGRVLQQLLGRGVGVRAVVRPDSLKDGDATEYTLHEGLVDSLFRPDQTNMANVAHFMCELATDADVWAAWRGKLPVIVNTARA